MFVFPPFFPTSCIFFDTFLFVPGSGPGRYDGGIRKVAVTNAPRLNAELMLRALGLEGYFEHLVIGTECTRAKPFPDPYLEGMRLVGATDAARCVAFEDSPTGLGAAVAAGIPTAGTQGAPRLILT